MDKTQGHFQKLQRLKGGFAGADSKYSWTGGLMSNQRPNLHSFTKYFAKQYSRWAARTLLFRLFEGFDQFGDDLEQVADDAIIGNFENRGIRVFIDGYYGSRPLHSHKVLDRPGDAYGHVHLRANGLSRTAHLAFHGKPAGIADGPRRGQFLADDIGQFLDQRDILRFLDAASDRDDELGGAQIHGARRFPEALLRRGTHIARGHRRREHI